MSRTATHPDRRVDHQDIRVLVGWQHNDMPNGIDLRVQSTTSLVALENDQIATQHLVMTRNQALLLGRYLLGTVGHTLEDDKPRGMWMKLKRAFSR